MGAVAVASAAGSWGAGGWGAVASAGSWGAGGRGAVASMRSGAVAGADERVAEALKAAAIAVAASLAPETLPVPIGAPIGGKLAPPIACPNGNAPGAIELPKPRAVGAAQKLARDRAAAEAQRGSFGLRRGSSEVLLPNMGASEVLLPNMGASVVLCDEGTADGAREDATGTGAANWNGAPG